MEGGVTKNEFLTRLSELGREYEVLLGAALKLEGCIHELTKELEEAEDTIQQLREELAKATQAKEANT